MKEEHIVFVEPDTPDWVDRHPIAYGIILTFCIITSAYFAILLATL